MGIEKRYTCDLCGDEVGRDQLLAVMAGPVDKRREDLDKVYVGPCCLGRPIHAIVSEADRQVLAGQAVRVE